MYQECLQSNYTTDAQQSNGFRFYGERHPLSAWSTSGDVFGVRDNGLAHLTDMFTVRTGRDWDPNAFFPWKPRENMTKLTMSPVEKGRRCWAGKGYTHIGRKCSLELCRPYQAVS
jgi:hypothetical protein